MTAGAGRVMVAGIGNVFLGDDAFGVEVVNRLDRSALPAEADVVDVGIRGVHLAYDLLDGRHPTLVLVDAVPMNEPPGTLAVLEVDADPAQASVTALDVVDGAAVDAHSMNPHVVLRTLRGLGGEMPRTVVVGCEPAAYGEGFGLSAPVSAVLDDAVALVTDVVRGEVARLKEAHRLATVESG